MHFKGREEIPMLVWPGIKVARKVVLSPCIGRFSSQGGLFESRQNPVHQRKKGFPKRKKVGKDAWPGEDRGGTRLSPKSYLLSIEARKESFTRERLSNPAGKD